MGDRNNNNKSFVDEWRKRVHNDRDDGNMSPPVRSMKSEATGDMEEAISDFDFSNSDSEHCIEDPTEAIIHLTNNINHDEEERELTEDERELNKQLIKKLTPDSLSAIRTKSSRHELIRTLCYRCTGSMRVVFNIHEGSCFFLPPPQHDSSLAEFRRKIMSVISSDWFDKGILVLILINSIQLCLDTPGMDHADAVASTLQIIDITFLVFYSLEALVKIMALGFWQHRYSYLRSTWNQVDFFIVFMSVLEYCIPGTDGSALKTLRLTRVLRPLRTISRVQGMRIIVSTLVQSFSSLVDAFTLLLFFLVISAILGVKLFSGSLHKRCYVSSDVALAYDNNITYLFENSSHADYDGYNSSLNTSRNWLVLNDSEVCGGGRQCSTNGLNMNQTCMTDLSLYQQDILNFDNIGTALLMVYKLISLDDWPGDMNTLQNSESHEVWVYFFLVTVLGGFFCINLVLAVLSSTFHKAASNDSVNQSRVLEYATVSTTFADVLLCPPLFFALPPSQFSILITTTDDDEESVCSSNEMSDVNAGELKALGYDVETLDDEMPDNSGHSPCAQTRTGRRVSVIGLPKQDDELQSWRRPIYHLVQSILFNRLMLTTTAMNVIIMASSFHGMSSSVSTNLDICNFACSVVFGFEMTLKLIGLGVGEYFKDKFNAFDCLLVLTSIPSLVSGPEGGGGSLSSFRIFRMARLARILKLANRMETLRKLLSTITSSVFAVMSLSGLMFLFLFIFSVLGSHLFGTSNVNIRPGFGDLWSSALTVFIVITGESWGTIMKQTMKATSAASCIYFLILFTLGNYILINLFIAILIDNFGSFSDTEEHVQDLDQYNPTDILKYLQNRMHKKHGMRIEEQRIGQKKINNQIPIPSIRLNGMPVDSEGKEIVKEATVTSVNSHSNDGRNRGRSGLNFFELVQILRRRSVAQFPTTGFQPEIPVATTFIERADVQQYITQRGVISYLSIDAYRQGGVDLPPTDSERFETILVDDCLCLRLKKREEADLLTQFSEGENEAFFSYLSFDPPRVKIGSTVKAPDSLYPLPRRSGFEAGGVVVAEQELRMDPSDRNWKVQEDFENEVHWDWSWETSDWMTLPFKFEFTTPEKIAGVLLLKTFSEIELQYCHNETDSWEQPEYTEHKKGESRIVILNEVLEATKFRVKGKYTSEAKVSLLLGRDLNPLDSIWTYSVRNPKTVKDEHPQDNEEDPWADCNNQFYSRNNILVDDALTNKQRAAKVVLHPAFDIFILFLIVLNAVVLSMNDPSLKHKPELAKVLSVLDIVITILFFCEMVIKIYVFGLWNAKNAYLRDTWNRLDCFVVFTAAIAIFFKNLFFFRALRIIKLAVKSTEVKLIISSLFEAVPAMGNVVLVCSFAWLIFGIVGLQLFMGSFYYCNDDQIEDIQHCNGTYIVVHRDAFGEYEEEHEREWLNTRYNFDHIGSAITALFECAVGEGWAAIMLTGIDSQSDTKSLKRDSRPYVAVFFVLFAVVGQFMAMNLFIGVLIDKFAAQKARNEGSWCLTQRQQDWVKSQRTLAQIELLQHPPLQPRSGIYGRLKRFCHSIVTNIWFDYIVMSIIVTNTVIMSLEHHNMNQSFESTLKLSSYIFYSIYVVECILKMVGFGATSYFLDNWNRYDFMIIILSTTQLLFVTGSGSSATAARVIRVGRMFRLVNKWKGLRELFQTLIGSVPHLVNIGFLLAVVFFCYGVVGVNLFGEVAIGGPGRLHRHSNFQTLYYALITLYQVSTTETWTDVMSACSLSPPLCDEDGGDCGPNALWVALYFYSFMIIGSFIVLNLFITVVLDQFGDLMDQLDNTFVFDAFNTYRRCWLAALPDGNRLMPCRLFVKFLTTLPSPLWGRMPSTSLNMILGLGEIPIPIDNNFNVEFGGTVTAFAARMFSLTPRQSKQASRFIPGLFTDEAAFTIVHWYCVDRIWAAYSFHKVQKQRRQACANLQGQLTQTRWLLANAKRDADIQRTAAELLQSENEKLKDEKPTATLDNKEINQLENNRNEDNMEKASTASSGFSAYIQTGVNPNNTFSGVESTVITQVGNYPDDEGGGDMTVATFQTDSQTPSTVTQDGGMMSPMSSLPPIKSVSFSIQQSGVSPVGTPIVAVGKSLSPNASYSPLRAPGMSPTPPSPPPAGRSPILAPVRRSPSPISFSNSTQSRPTSPLLCNPVSGMGGVSPSHRMPFNSPTSLISPRVQSESTNGRKQTVLKSHSAWPAFEESSVVLDPVIVTSKKFQKPSLTWHEHHQQQQQLIQSRPTTPAASTVPSPTHRPVWRPVSPVPRQPSPWPGSTVDSLQSISPIPVGRSIGNTRQQSPSWGAQQQNRFTPRQSPSPWPVEGGQSNFSTSPIPVQQYIDHSLPVRNQSPGSRSNFSTSPPLLAQKPLLKLPMQSSTARSSPSPWPVAASPRQSPSPWPVNQNSTSPIPGPVSGARSSPSPWPIAASPRQLPSPWPTAASPRQLPSPWPVTQNTTPEPVQMFSGAPSSPSPWQASPRQSISSRPTQQQVIGGHVSSPTLTNGWATPVGMTPSPSPQPPITNTEGNKFNTIAGNHFIYSNRGVSSPASLSPKSPINPTSEYTTFGNTHGENNWAQSPLSSDGAVISSSASPATSTPTQVVPTERLFHPPLVPTSLSSNEMSHRSNQTGKHNRKSSSEAYLPPSPVAFPQLLPHISPRSGTYQSRRNSFDSQQTTLPLMVPDRGINSPELRPLSAPGGRSSLKFETSPETRSPTPELLPPPPLPVVNNRYARDPFEYRTPEPVMSPTITQPNSPAAPTVTPATESSIADPVRRSSEPFPRDQPPPRPTPYGGVIRVCFILIIDSFSISNSISLYSMRLVI